MEVIRFSASQLSSLTMCGEAYRREYIDGKTPPASLSMIRGIAGHHAFELAMTEKKKTGGQPEDYLMLEAAFECIDGYRPDEKAVYLPPSKEGMTKDACLDEIKKELKGYMPQISDLMARIVPTEVETAKAIQFKVPSLGPDVWIVVEGRRDVLGFIPGLVDGEIPAIIDLKTCGKAKSQRDADNSVQMTLYATIQSPLTSIPIEQIPLAIAFATPKKSDILLTTRNQTDMDAFMQFLVRAAMVKRAGLFIPASRDHWKCSPEYCQHFASCAFVGVKSVAEKLTSCGEVEAKIDASEGAE